MAKNIAKSTRANGHPPDLGGSVALDHVNFKISDQTISTRFFVEGLGLTRDPYRFPGTGNMWVNVGRQQFHLPTMPPEPFPGEIGLVVPDLKKTEGAIKAVADQLKGTKFSLAKEKGALVVKDPWGRQLRLHGEGSLQARLPLGLAYVVFEVPEGAAAALATFYERGFDCPVRVGKKGGSATATVRVGAHQEFRFVEKKNANLKTHNNHVCLYVTRYEQIRDTLGEHGATPMDAMPTQFRFLEVRAGGKGPVVFRCEHEIRSLYHKDFGRPLVNRQLDSQP